MQKLRLEFFGDGPRLDDLSGQSGAFPSRGRESLRCKYRPEFIKNQIGS